MLWRRVLCGAWYSHVHRLRGSWARGSVPLCIETRFEPPRGANMTNRKRPAVSRDGGSLSRVPVRRIAGANSGQIVFRGEGRAAAGGTIERDVYSCKQVNRQTNYVNDYYMKKKTGKKKQ